MDQSSARTKKLNINIIIILITKGLSILISIIYVPLLWGSMDTDNYALWLTLTSLVSWIALLDIGLGNGLRNKLAEALALKDYNLGKMYVSTAYCGVIAIGAVLVVLFIILSPHINWTNVFNTTTVNSETLKLLVGIVFYCFILHFVFGLINSILFAVQLPAISSFCTFIGQAITFAIVYIIVKVYNITDIITLASIISGTPVIILILTSIILFRSKFKHILPSFNSVDFARINDIMSLGVKFFFLQIVTIIIFQTNNVIIIHSIDNNSVVIYNVVYKYLYTLVTIFTVICAPIWSATTEAFTVNDFDWIVKTKKKLLLLAGIFTAVGCIMVLASHAIYHIWLGNENPDIKMSTTALMYMYCVFMMLYSVYGYIINGTGKLSIQIVCTSIIAAAYIPSAYYSGKYFGLNGIIVIMILTAVLNFIWSKTQLTLILTNKAKGIWNK